MKNLFTLVFSGVTLDDAQILHTLLKTINETFIGWEHQTEGDILLLFVPRMKDKFADPLTDQNIPRLIQALIPDSKRMLLEGDSTGWLSVCIP